jgi:hypothetical protein
MGNDITFVGILTDECCKFSEGFIAAAIIYKNDTGFRIFKRKDDNLSKGILEASL